MAGPFYKYADFLNYYSWSKSYTQKRPWVNPMSYDSYSVEISNRDSVPSSTRKAGTMNILYHDDDTLYQSALRKAYDRFKEEVGTQASLGITIAQRQKSIDMISDRAVQLLDIFRSIKNGNFTRAHRKMSLRPKGKSKGKVKDTAGVILETNYGWTPLLADMVASAEVLSKPFKNHILRGRGSAEARFGSRVLWPGTQFVQKDESYRQSIKVKLQSQFIVENPNLFLAAQMGLINPASVAWDAVPFSFVVDQFVNIGKFLVSFTDFVGLSFQGPSTSSLSIVDFNQYAKGHPWYHADEYSRFIGRSKHFSRTLGISKPAVRILPPKRFSLKRAINDVSLLVGFLKSI